MFSGRSKPLFLVLLLLALPLLTFAHGESEFPLVVGSVGLYDADSSVLYSILLSSGDEALTDLTVSSQLPENASFVDVFWTPESATLEGETDGTVTWTLDSLPANSVLGPFTYRVTFAEGATVPYRAPASVTWSIGEASAESDDLELPVLEPTGSIIIDPAGTDGLVQVEETGVYMYVPEGTFSQTVTFTFERLPITDDTPMPTVTVDEDIWWCTLFNITIEPAGIVATQPILIAFPTRRTLTPDLPVFNFIQTPGSEWEVAEHSEETASAKVLLTPQFTHIPVIMENRSVISPSGNQIIAVFDSTTGAGFSYTGGVPTNARLNAITDGTSNTNSLMDWYGQDFIGNDIDIHNPFTQSDLGD